MPTPRSVASWQGLTATSGEQSSPIARAHRRTETPFPSEVTRTFSSEFVFVSSKREPFRSLRTAFTTACHHANLAAVSPHILRHTFASRLAMAGVDIRTLQELGGWKEIKMVERYAHLSTQHKTEAISKMAHPTSEDSSTVFTTPKSSLRKLFMGR